MQIPCTFLQFIVSLICFTLIALQMHARVRQCILHVNSRRLLVAATCLAKVLQKVVKTATIQGGAHVQKEEHLLFPIIL